MMRGFWLVFRNSTQRLWPFFIAAVGLGMVLIILFHLMSDVTGNYNYGAIRIGLVDADTSVTSAAIGRYCSDDLGMEFFESTDEDALNKELLEKHISAVVTIPAGFERSLLAGSAAVPLEVTYMADYENALFLEAYLDNYTNSLQVLALGAQGEATRLGHLLDDARTLAAPLDIRALDPGITAQNTLWDAIILTLGFFLMLSFLLGLGMAQLLYDDRKGSTYARVRVTSVRAPSYILGLCAAGLVGGVLMLIPVYLYWLLMGYGQTIPLLPTFLMSLLFLLFVVGIGLVGGMLLPTQGAIFTMVISVGTILSLLGGAWFPIERVPLLMQQIARFTPHFWYLEALKGFRDGVPDGWVMPACILVLFALLCYLITGLRFVIRRNTERV